MQRQTLISSGLQMAALAHDLRTPMCVAAGAAQMALEAGGKDVSAQLRQILQAVGTMDRMISMMSEPQEAAAIPAFSGEMLQRELLAMLEERAQQKEQRLSIDLSALDGFLLEADYAALCRLMINLLGNAVKYTQEGGEITLRAQILMHPWAGRLSRIRFVVADNGMGMQRVFMRKMYMPYIRAQESAHLPGKGLGLMIARKLVRDMGGTIRVKSKRQRGTTFTVTIPAALRQTEQEKKRSMTAWN